MNQNKILIAVSGGPDSMFLLNLYKDKNIVVATVNYNQRQDSYNDVKIVREFCKLYNIKFYLLEKQKSDYTSGNFQKWAREQRYVFFKQIYDQEQCNKILIAHNKDDFIETSIMQHKSKKYTMFYGIKKNNYLYGMNIERPLLYKYWKDTIFKKCVDLGIPFYVDYTNNEPKYNRNEIRLKNSKKKIFKFYFYWKTRLKNIFLIYKSKKINKEYEDWQKNNFNQDFFLELNHQKELVYHYINTFFDGINLSSKKIDNIIKFILSKNRTQKFKLSNSIYLYKKKGNLINNKV
ncbi:tRNA lysidine(34) synthetase TilS [Mycoplasma leonicaptivi]|uniref:tRNA lysidine(34) synthetase TilS n=1 Tax=Mycoplasma leonicaptivi TaxID=36742 RepID=UPI00048023DD|nr:tRNA lysidine(34) synthetase TilS [Mycoplasma leonicaptivi]